MQTHLSSCSEKNYSNNGCVMLKILIGLLVVVLVVAAAVACGLALKGLEEKHAKRNLNSRIDTTPLQCFPQWQGDSQAKLMRLAYLTVSKNVSLLFYSFFPVFFPLFFPRRTYLTHLNTLTRQWKPCSIYRFSQQQFKPPGGQPLRFAKRICHEMQHIRMACLTTQTAS